MPAFPAPFLCMTPKIRIEECNPFHQRTNPERQTAAMCGFTMTVKALTVWKPWDHCEIWNAVFPSETLALGIQL